MRKLLLSIILTMAATSTALAAGGGYNGTVVANVYQYLDAHGCPGAGFGLLNCSYYRPPLDHHDGRRHGISTR